jgi:hypothetical protein
MRIIYAKFIKTMMKHKMGWILYIFGILGVGV